MAFSWSKIRLNKSSVLPWVILIFGTINIVFLGGKRRAFGVFIAVLHKEFSNVTLSELNSIGGSNSAVGFMTSSLSTAAILYFKRRYGLFQFLAALFILLGSVSSSFVPNPHWLFITFTLLHGLGSGMVLANVGLVVSEHFNKNHRYHLLASTLICGGSFAAILFVSLFAYIIQEFNWRTSFIILGILYFTVNASAAIFFQKKEDESETISKKVQCGSKEASVMQIPLLLLWFLDRFITSAVTYGLLLNLTDYIFRTNPSLVRSTVLTTLFAAGEAMSYVTTAIITALAQRFFKNRLRYLLFSTSIISGVALIVLEYTREVPIARKVLCFLTGFSLGFSNTLFFPVGEELTLLPGHLAYTFSLAGMGSGTLISPFLTAKIAEIFAYQWFFFAQGCLIFVKVFCISVIFLLLFLYKTYCGISGDTEEMTEYKEIEVKSDISNGNYQTFARISENKAN